MTAPEQMRADVRLLLENGFRNIDLPPLDDLDLADIAGALDSIAALTRPAPAELVEAAEAVVKADKPEDPAHVAIYGFSPNFALTGAIGRLRTALRNAGAAS